jgi:hypothetical protein
VEDLTDVATKDLMLAFVQFFQKGEVKTKFLFIRDVLRKSMTANAFTLKQTLIDGLPNLNLNINNLASLCTDGAAVMISEKNRLAGLLRLEILHILTYHCVYHRSALAVTDSISINLPYATRERLEIKF